MKNKKIIAVIFAGGTGSRMKISSIPKQFMEYKNKPIIIYTLEHFQNHSLVDGIVVVCISGWIDFLKEKCKEFNITKVISVVQGGTTGQESIKNGLLEVEKLFNDNPIVMIHDGVRPLINEKVITDNIECVKKNGNSITVNQATETVIKIDGENIIEISDRSKYKLARAPQCFYLNDILSSHKKAILENKNNFIDSAMLMKYYGYNLYTVNGPSENIKITTPVDFEIFKAYMEYEW